MSETTGKILNMKTYGPSEEIAKKTQAYAMFDVKIAATDSFAKVPDILKGGDRKRKFGMVMSMACIPNLHEQEEPLIVGADMPTILVDADTIEDLEERAVAEIKGMTKILQDTLDGKIVPPIADDFEESKQE